MAGKCDHVATAKVQLAAGADLCLCDVACKYFVAMMEADVGHGGA